jgi:hypothetical protein
MGGPFQFLSKMSTAYGNIFSKRSDPPWKCFASMNLSWCGAILVYGLVFGLRRDPLWRKEPSQKKRLIVDSETLFPVHAIRFRSAKVAWHAIMPIRDTSTLSNASEIWTQTSLHTFLLPPIMFQVDQCVLWYVSPTITVDWSTVNGRVLHCTTVRYYCSTLAQ